MDKINQQIIELNNTKEIVLRDSFAQNAHKNLHIIIAECMYANRENKTRKSIQLTTQNTINWVNSDLKNALN